MPDSVINVLRQHKIKEAKIINENAIRLSLEDYDVDVKLFAAADCCSESWFEISGDLNDLVGKKITNINNTGEIDLPASNRQEYDKNHKYEMVFEDESTPFIFILRNSSNGYYSGWLEMKFKKKE